MQATNTNTKTTTFTVFFFWQIIQYGLVNVADLLVVNINITYYTYNRIKENRVRIPLLIIPSFFLLELGVGKQSYNLVFWGS